VLRTLAALAVAAFHFQFDLARSFPGISVPDMTRGAAGVDVFFVISGFVITRSALLSPDSGARYFLARRLIRIVPLYWAVTLLYLVLAALPTGHDSTYTLPNILASFVFIPFPRADGVMQPVIGQGWSLNYEMMFYLMFAAALGLSRRYAGALVVAALLSIVAVGTSSAGSAQFEFWSSAIVLEFAAGVALAEVHARGATLPRPLAVAGVLVALAAYLFAPVPSTELGFARLLGWGVPAVMLVGSVALSAQPLAPRWQPLLLLGAASYGMYLLHSVPNRGVVLVLGRLGLDGSTSSVFAVGLVLSLSLTVMLSVIAHTAFERPMMQWLRKRLERSFRRAQEMKVETPAVL